MPRRPYGLVDMPQPADPLQSLSAIMRMAGTAQEFGDRRKAAESKTAIETALQQSNGNLDKTVDALRAQGRWSEATTIMGKSAEIRKSQQEELSATYDRTQKGFQTATQLLQGVDATEDPVKRSEMFAAVRPKLVEALPGFDSYIPQRYDDDPGFVSRAIPIGLSASEVAARRKDAVAKLNEKWAKAGDQLTRDNAVTETLASWLEDAETGEEVNQVLDTAENAYGASKTVRQRVGEVPPGPLSKEARAAIVSRLTKQAQAKTPTLGSEEDFIVSWAKGKGLDPSALSAAQKVQARAQWTSAGRDPDGATNRREATIAQKAVAERWKQDALAKLEEGLADGTFSQADIPAAKARIQASYLEQINATAAKPAPQSRVATTPSAGTVPAPMADFFKDKGAGVVTLSDRSKWRKAADGTITPVR